MLLVEEVEDAVHRVEYDPVRVILAAAGVHEMKGGQRARAAGVVGDAALAAGHAGAASAVLRAPEADEQQRRG